MGFWCRRLVRGGRTWPVDKRQLSMCQHCQAWRSISRLTLVAGTSVAHPAYALSLVAVVLNSIRARMKAVFGGESKVIDGVEVQPPK